MKIRFSLNQLMHNKRLMIGFSLLAAIGIWLSVIYGPGNIEKRAITVKVPVDITNSYAYQTGLRIVGTSVFEVEVQVEGKWSVISQLTETDIRVRPDISTIQKAGATTVTLTAGYNSSKTDYEIKSVTPSAVTVNCDYWENGLEFKVKADISSVTVVDPQVHQLGDPVIDPAVVPDGIVVLEGPKSVTSQVSSIVARVTATEAIQDVKVFSATLVALDETGQEIDISSCRFRGLETLTVNVTVPVWVYRTVDFTYSLANVPDMLAGVENLVTVSPTSVVLVGPQNAVDQFADDIADLGTFDFDNLSPAQQSFTIPLNIPESVRVLDDTKEVAVNLKIGSYSTKSLNFTLTKDSVVVLNKPSDRTVNISQQTITSVQIVGNSRVLSAISADDLVATIDLSEVTTVGPTRCQVRFHVKNRDDCWIYYGAEQHGFEIYIAVE